MSDLNSLLERFHANRASLEAEELYTLTNELIEWAESAQQLADTMSRSNNELEQHLNTINDERFALRKRVEELEAAGIIEVKNWKAGALINGWKVAAIAWAVCASIHRKYAKGKDQLFNTRQQDFNNSHIECKARISQIPVLLGPNSFNEVWRKMEANGIQFSAENIEKVRIGWDMLVDKLNKENKMKPPNRLPAHVPTPVSLIVAVNSEGYIGKDNDLMYHLPEDMKRFKELTKNNVLVMGRKTFESLPRVLPGRPHLVVTRNPEAVKIPRNPTEEQVTFFSSLEDAVQHARQQAQDGSLLGIAVIGGAQIYKEALVSGEVDQILITEVLDNTVGDVRFPICEYAEAARRMLVSDSVEVKDGDYNTVFYKYVRVQVR